MPTEAPSQNFERGLRRVDLSGLGDVESGKVRDMVIVDGLRVTVTTDRTSAYDAQICTVPGKGAILNLLSNFWFNRTEDIIRNHSIFTPHPYVLVSHQAKEKLPVEIVLRRYMVRSQTSTSVYYNYVELGRRNIYGIDFPAGLVANQEFPMETILTPTTKADKGHDLELTDEEARDLVNRQFGPNVWAQTKDVASRLFVRAYKYHEDKDLILADTKYEFGVDGDGRLMLIDEVHTPDSSRFWLSRTYQARFESGQNPEAFDKEILRRWLAETGFTGLDHQKVPVVDQSVIDQMSAAYRVPYRMVTGYAVQEASSNPEYIREIIVKYLEKTIR